MCGTLCPPVKRGKKMNKYAKDQQELRRICANLTFAKQLGLIEDDSLAAAEERCRLENARRGEKLAAGETVYGLTAYPLPAYLQYECTRFRLAFAGERKAVHYDYAPITTRDEKAYYKANKDLFTRYMGDKFRFGEVKQVVHKKMREEEYDRAIQDLLR